MSRKPSFAEPNLAAMIAAVIGSICGLFALGIAPALITGNPRFLAAVPTLNVICFFLCGVFGWLLGGQLGPRLEGLFGEKNGYIIGGILSGLLPVLAVIAFGWYMAMHPANP